MQGNKPCCCSFLVLYSVAIVFFVFCYVLLLFLSLHHNLCLFWLQGGRDAACVLFEQVFLSTSITIDLFFSGFFWLLSLLLSSLLWYAVVPLRDKLVFGLVFSVLFQEVFRFLFHAPCHFMQSHIHKVYACLAVTCHLHFWQNDRSLLRATAVTRGWNGYRNKSQHRKLTLEKKILPPLQQGFEPATFQSRVRRSNH